MRKTYFSKAILATVMVVMVALLQILFSVNIIKADKVEDATADILKIASFSGECKVTNLRGTKKSIKEGTRLLNGDVITTGEDGTMKVLLDATKAISIDKEARVLIKKNKTKLEVVVDKGTVFFNVSKKLEDNESLNIRTSNMICGVRGTIGVVEGIDADTSSIYILEGQVEVTGRNLKDQETVIVEKEQKVTITKDKTVNVPVKKEKIEESDISDWVYDQVEDDSDLKERVSASEIEAWPEVENRVSGSSSSGGGGGGCFVAGTKIYMADHTVKKVEELIAGDEVLIYDHYTGKVSSDVIAVNAHEDQLEEECDVFTLTFSDGRKLNLTYSHGLFDKTENKYVSLNKDNAAAYIGHKFVVISKAGKLGAVTLERVDVRKETVKYYAPISRYHVNVVAEGLLTTLSRELVRNFFPMTDDMIYDMSAVEIVGITPYEKLEAMITREEYDNLPCQYLDAILYNHPDCTFSDFELVVTMLRHSGDLSAWKMY